MRDKSKIENESRTFTNKAKINKWQPHGIMLSLIKAAGKYFSKKDNMTMVRKRYQLIPTRDIDDKRTLYYDWTRGTPAHTQPTVVLSDAYLCLSPSK